MDQKVESTACDLKHVFISVSKGSSQKAKLPGCQQWGYNNHTNNSQVYCISPFPEKFSSLHSVERNVEG
jgi:hypothetical protein